MTTPPKLTGLYQIDRYRQHHPRPTAPTLRIVAFGFAGGSITALLPLGKSFPADIEVWGIEYPGRGLRWQEAAVDRIEPLLAALLPDLKARPDLPTVFLGFSMGAHIAYHAALRIPEAVRALIVLSARPPQYRVTDWPEMPLADSDLIARMTALGGMPPEILTHPDLLSLYLPIMRNDLALCHDLSRLPWAPLPRPVLAMQGEQDPLLRQIDLRRWPELSSARPARSAHLAWSGGHFFHKGRESEISAAITDWLEPLRIKPAASPDRTHEPMVTP
jgi:surfactin synthase thioesterase subunit